MLTDEKCPRCEVGFIQRTALTPPDKGEAIGCTRCTYPVGEPGFSSDLSYDPMEVDEGWEPPYRPVLSDKEMGDKVKQAVAPMWHNIDALQKERERLIKKLEKIENLSRYAWQQVRNNPDEAEELFKMINLESK